jgi:hypothetical protein
MDQERADLLESLRVHRGFLRHTLNGVSEADARRRTTVSELTLGGVLKHVLITEEGWAQFVAVGTSAMASTPENDARHGSSFSMTDGDTVAALLAEYEQVAAVTDALVASLPSLDVSHPLPEAPWFPPGATRSARRVFVHIVGETAQHAGHADIIREALDGQKTMG